MALKKILTVICALGIILINLTAMNISAEELDNPTNAIVLDENTDATGLIRSFALVITANVKTVKITATTNGTDIMAKIGFTNIKIQRSTNGTSGWVNELTPGDDTATNALSHSKNNESKNVAGGYYYRVVLDHYAKETGWFFPSSQSITNYSNVVWVPTS